MDIRIKKAIWRYVKSLGLVVFMSLLGEFIQRRLEPTNLVMLYLLSVVVVASLWGRGPAIFTSIVSVIAFDFLFIPSRFTLTVDNAFIWYLSSPL